MTKFLTEKKRTLGSDIQMSTVSKATELSDAELDLVAGGVQKAGLTTLVGDDIGAVGRGTSNIYPSRN